MKHLRGYTKRYFSLAVIAMYSTLERLAKIDNNYKYHKLFYKQPEHKTSPPTNLLLNKYF